MNFIDMHKIFKECKRFVALVYETTSAKRSIYDLFGQVHHQQQQISLNRQELACHESLDQFRKHFYCNVHKAHKKNQLIKLRDNDIVSFYTNPIPIIFTLFAIFYSRVCIQLVMTRCIILPWAIWVSDLPSILSLKQVINGCGLCVDMRANVFDAWFWWCDGKQRFWWMINSTRVYKRRHNSKSVFLSDAPQ